AKSAASGKLRTTSQTSSLSEEEQPVILSLPLKYEKEPSENEKSKKLENSKSLEGQAQDSSAVISLPEAETLPPLSEITEATHKDEEPVLVRNHNNRNRYNKRSRGNNHRRRRRSGEQGTSQHKQTNAQPLPANSESE